MSKNLALTLARAKNSGIREGIDAVCEAMALAHYNAAIELELDEREVSIMLDQLCMMYECFDAVENRRRYKVRRLENRLKEAPACSK